MGDSREKFVRSCCGLAGTNHVQARSFGCEKGRGPDPIWKGAPALVIADERSGLGLCSTLQIDARTDPSACRNGGGRDVCCKDRTWKHGNLRSFHFAADCLSRGGRVRTRLSCHRKVAPSSRAHCQVGIRGLEILRNSKDQTINDAAQRHS